MDVLNEARARKAVMTIVGRCSAIRMTEFVDQSLVRCIASDVWAKFACSESFPIARLRCETSRPDLAVFVSEVLSATAEEQSCLISIGGFGNLPWLRTTFSDVHEGIRQIWNNLQAKELMCANCSGTLVRAISEEEYEYLAFELKLA